MKKLILCTLFILFLTGITTTVMGQDNMSGKDAIELHKKGWSSVVSEARNDKYAKYGIYTSRTMAVFHPEIYLKADMLFLRSVDKKYLTGLLNDDYQYNLSAQFKLSNIVLEQYKTLRSRQFYPQAAPYLNFLDRRMLPVASSLRAKGEGQIKQPEQIKEIELGSLFYSMQRIEHGRASDELFIIYCDNENTYVKVENRLYSMSDLKKTEEVAGNPVLIFNEKAVWYPVMGRDDTTFNQNLKSIVNQYRTSITKPQLSYFEDKTIKVLRIVTKLPMEQRTLAVLAAAQLNSHHGRGNKRLEQTYDLWNEVFESHPQEVYDTTVIPHPAGSLGYIVISKLITKANKLSPLAAYGSSLIEKGQQPFASLKKWYKDNFEYNDLWGLCLVSQTIDESFGTKDGTCVVHAEIWNSILKLNDIKTVTIHRYRPNKTSHRFIYLPQFNRLASNFNLFSIENLSKPLYLPVFLLSTEDEWSTAIQDRLLGNMDNSQLIKIYKQLIAKEDFNVKGLTTFLEVAINTTNPEKVIKYIKTNKIEKIRLP